MFDENYLLGDVLGRGGMGVVYAATQRSLDRAVAVKLPHAELMNDPFVANRFRIEAVAGSRLAHKNVARVIDFGGGDQCAPYIVMELISGTRLDILRCEAGALDTRVAVDLCRQLLAALEAAHSAGVVHADIKTANVLVETLPDGVLLARLIDFGLARLLDEPSQADARVLSGTPDYLAPELVQGGVPSVASDIYAAGVVLYELLTGSTPFGGGTSADILQRQLVDDVVPPTLRCPEQHVPPAIEAAIMRALAKAPRKRFATTTEFAASLEGPRPGATVPARHFARGTQPIAGFSTEATTRSWACELVLPASAESAIADVSESRRAVDVALASNDGDMIVTAYLELARVLVDRRELALAATDLARGLAVLRARDGARRTPVWRLQLCLAAVLSGLGERARAKQAALVGRDDADHVASALGRDRANDLIARLSHASV